MKRWLRGGVRVRESRDISMERDAEPRQVEDREVEEGSIGQIPRTPSP